MKKKVLLLMLSTIGPYVLWAQNNCSKFYPMEEGTSYQYTMYNKKDKPDGTIDYLVSEVNSSGGETYATMQLKFEDEKGKNVMQTDYNITCTGNGVKIDFESLFPAQMRSQYENMGMEMDITGTDIQLPNDLSVGQSLEDAHMNVSMDTGVMKMKVDIETTDRKVEAKESLTTSAGTFDCYLITEKNRSKVMMANQEFSNKVWLAEGVGMVKQESYNKSGKLMGRMELTKFSR
ncbi:MAG: hypothetical protein AAFX53_14995 [Bacteroidota bacterium]